MCFVFIWEQTATCATYSINWLVFITEKKSVYSAVRTGALNKAVCASFVLQTTNCHLLALQGTHHIFHVSRIRFNTFWARLQNWQKKRLLLASSCLSVRRSAWKNSYPTGRIFMKCDICVFFEIRPRKLRISLKSNKNSYFTRRPKYIFDHISHNSSWNEKCSGQKFIEPIKTHSLRSMICFSKIIPFMR